MVQPTQPDHPLITLIDEISRMHGRVKTAFALARDITGLGEMEMTVLNAVAEADIPPTVSQIGRSLGHPRQVIQRAANGLIEQGHIIASNNPDHKRASLLHATPQGAALKAQANIRAAEIADKIMTGIDAKKVEKTAKHLSEIRHGMEAQLRENQ